LSLCRSVISGIACLLCEAGQAAAPEELAEHACINIRQTTGNLYRWQFEERLPRGKVRKFQIAVRGPLVVNWSPLSLSAAVSAVGLVNNIADIVEPLVGRELLEPWLEGFVPKTPGFFIYFPSRAQVLPKLRAFLDFWDQVQRHP
jgi:DNA-binding transcriptional LysR family regulator